MRATHGHVGVPYCVYRSANTSEHPKEFISIRSRYDRVEKYNDSFWMPSELEDRLMRVAPGMSQYERRYWWRAQGAAYLLRLNDRTISRLAALRRNESATFYRFPPGADHPIKRQDDANEYLFPPGTISAHVRQGDKGMELKPIPLESYLLAAEAAVGANPLGIRRLIFLSSENPLNVLLLKNFSKAVGVGYLSTTWYGVASEIPRHNSNGNVQGAFFGFEFMIERWLLQLLMALECDVFIGWRASNWNRLVDELRCVWVPKCSSPFYEVGSADGKRYSGYPFPGQGDPNNELDGVYSHIGPLGW